MFSFQPWRESHANRAGARPLQNLSGGVETAGLDCVGRCQPARMVSTNHARVSFFCPIRQLTTLALFFLFFYLYQISSYRTKIDTDFLITKTARPEAALFYVRITIYCLTGVAVMLRRFAGNGFLPALRASSCVATAFALSSDILDIASICARALWKSPLFA